MPLRVPVPQSSFLRVPSDLEAVSAARREIVATVRGWALPVTEDTVQTLELLAGEVIANAVVHTGNACHVTLHWDGVRVRLEAEDVKPDPLMQSLRAELPTSSDRESGRGLRLVDCLALAWGAHPTRRGKSVWFEVGGPLPPTT